MEVLALSVPGLTLAHQFPPGADGLQALGLGEVAERSENALGQRVWVQQTIS